MKSFSNTYIFIFSAIMVAVVATVLSFAAMQLKPLQQKNIEIAKKLDILKSVYKGEEAEDAPDKNTYVEEQYNKYIVESFVINYKGELKEGVDAFNVNLKVEYTKNIEDQNLPVYIYKDDSGAEKPVIPVRGKGLWGPIWGYVSLMNDYNTIYGAIFDHEGETPGLGAEIATREFQAQFKEKQLFKDGEFVSVKVEKVKTSADNKFAVDGISGGTITSKGLESMLYNSLISYEDYFKSKMN